MAVNPVGRTIAESLSPQKGPQQKVQSSRGVGGTAENPRATVESPIPGIRLEIICNTVRVPARVHVHVHVMSVSVLEQFGSKEKENLLPISLLSSLKKVDPSGVVGHTIDFD